VIVLATLLVLAPVFSVLPKPVLAAIIARLKPAVREVLERNGVVGRIGDDKIHGNADHAVNAQLAAGGGDRTDK
jgi:hypothetical protein